MYRGAQFRVRMSSGVKQLRGAVLATDEGKRILKNTRRVVCEVRSRSTGSRLPLSRIHRIASNDVTVQVWSRSCQRWIVHFPTHHKLESRSRVRALDSSMLAEGQESSVDAEMSQSCRRISSAHRSSLLSCSASILSCLWKRLHFFALYSLGRSWYRPCAKHP